MQDCVEEMRRAFVLFGEDKVESPLRTKFAMTDVGNVLIMPSLIRAHLNTLSLKIVSVYPNLGPGKPSLSASVLLIDGSDGTVKALMGGAALTAVRTGAVTGLSCRYLARADAKVLAMIGAGGQGFHQISGVVSQIKIEKIIVFDLDTKRSIRLAERCRSELGISAKVSHTVNEATRGADVIVTATTSKTPVLKGDEVKRGTHVAAIGAYTPDSRELDSRLLSKASIYLDSMEAAMAEAGDILIPMKEGVITKQSVKGDLAGLAMQRIQGRTSETEVTLFKAVGLAFEDNAIGWLLYKKALSTGVGQWVDV
jgi:ornithine cyclodeaminase/alanine dehydrogenase-like protein (mu-crystallin family)